MKIILNIIVALYLITLISSCTKDKNSTPVAGDLPTISDITIVSITDTTVVCRVTIIPNGASSITSSGFCWNTSGDPTISDNKITCGAGTTTFTCTITGLFLGTTYYFKAFATNSNGSFYSPQKTATMGTQIEKGFESFTVNETLEYSDFAINTTFIDIDGDGENETSFRIHNSQDISGYFVPPYNNILVTVGQGSVFAPDIQFAYKADDNDGAACKSFIINETINDSTATFEKATYPYLAQHFILPDNIKQGHFSTGQESYIGFKIEIEKEFHFGWIKVKLSNDLKTLLIIDGAYNKEVEMGIRAGEN